MPVGLRTYGGPVRPTTDLERRVAPFKVVSDFSPSGDQPAAIDELERRVRAGESNVVLLGATGTGKSATTAWLVERLQRPTLVMAPNKTLAAQLATEFRELLPNNAVEYFVSYYDYYQPEAYIPQTDTYIEKDSSINDEVEAEHRVRRPTAKHSSREGSSAYRSGLERAVLTSQRHLTAVGLIGPPTLPTTGRGFAQKNISKTPS